MKYQVIVQKPETEKKNCKWCIALGLLFLLVPAHFAMPYINLAQQNESQPEVLVGQDVPKVEEEIVEEANGEPIEEVLSPPQYTGVCAEYYDLVNQYDWDTQTMLAIMKAESGCRPNARGDGNLTYQNNGRTYGYSLGLFQVRILEGREHCDTYDINTNIQCAYNIWKGQGYKAWSVYSNGRYLRFL